VAERPPIQAVGRITRIHEADRLFEVEMANGYRAYAILERKAPRPPEGAGPVGRRVRVDFSPFDMSRCKIASWNVEENPNE